MASKKPTDTDRKIGALIRKHRKANGWTLDALGDEIGVTDQQQQKYERGVEPGDRMATLRHGEGVKRAGGVVFS